MEDKKRALQAFEEWEIKMVNKKARSFLGKYGYTDSDLPDIEQDLFLSVLRTKSKRGKIENERGFVKKVLNRQAMDMIKSLKRDKRKVRLVSESLSKPVERLPSGDDLLLSDVLAETEKGDQTVNQRLEKPGVGHRFWMIFESLTDRQKDIIIKRDEGQSISQIAEAWNVHRDTIYEDLGRVQNIFTDGGLGPKKKNN